MSTSKIFQTGESRRNKGGSVPRRLAILAVTVAVGLSFGFADGSSTHASGPNLDAANPHQNELIVQFRDRQAFDKDTQHRTVGQVIDETPGLNARLLRVPDASNAVQGLRHNPNVLLVTENETGFPAQFDPNDQLYSSQWHLKERSATNGSNLRNAWNLTGGNSSNRLVIVDSGIDYNHPDLKGRIAGGQNFVPGQSSTAYGDCFGHGTNVAGVAAASTNNSIGVAGADLYGKIYVAKVAIDCKGSIDIYTTAKAIDESSKWAGTKVMNISLAWYVYRANGTCPAGAACATQSAVNYLGSAVQAARGRNVVVVAAAGNQATNEAAYPASFLGVLAVGATNSIGARASFSNWGSPNVDVTAPGEYICTTDLVSGGSSITSYACVNGTSFASPLVAGIAMLVRSRYPSSSEATIRTWIQGASFNPERNCWNCYSNNYGYGIVDAYWAAK